jgi:hypothetical protein
MFQVMKLFDVEYVGHIIRPVNIEHIEVTFRNLPQETEQIHFGISGSSTEDRTRYIQNKIL